MIGCMKGDRDVGRTDEISRLTVILCLTRYKEDMEVGYDPVMHEACQLPDLGAVRRLNTRPRQDSLQRSGRFYNDRLPGQGPPKRS